MALSRVLELSIRSRQTSRRRTRLATRGLALVSDVVGSHVVDKHEYDVSRARRSLGGARRERILGCAFHERGHRGGRVRRAHALPQRDQRERCAKRKTYHAPRSTVSHPGVVHVISSGLRARACVACRARQSQNWITQFCLDTNDSFRVNSHRIFFFKSIQSSCIPLKQGFGPGGP